MKVKIKKLVKHAVMPSYAREGDVGMDLTAISKTKDEYGNQVYGTGLAFEVPEGYFMMLVPRSSNAKKNLMLTNHCGLVDSSFRGEVLFKYAFVDSHEKETSIQKGVNSYEIGDRIGQLVILPYPHIEFEEVKELSETERGNGGYGSTGN